MHIFRLIRGSYTLYDPSEIAKIFYPVADYYDFEVHYRDGRVVNNKELQLVSITPNELIGRKHLPIEMKYHFHAKYVDYIIVNRKMYEYVVAPGPRNDPDEKPMILKSYSNRRLRISYNIHKGHHYKMKLVTMTGVSTRYYPVGMEVEALIVHSPEYRFYTNIGSLRFVPDSKHGTMTVSSIDPFAKPENILFIDLEEVY